MSQPFDFSKLYASNLPAPAGPYTGLAKYHFVGGNNDPAGIPTDLLAQAAHDVIQEQGKDLAIYYPCGGPKGDARLRGFLADKLQSYRGFNPTPEGIVVTSGSNHALDLICKLLLEPGDTVIAEAHSYSNMLGRIRKCGATVQAVNLDADGLDTGHLETILQEMADRNCVPKFIYTIPTVQNPTATVMPVARRRELLDISRRFGVIVIEDECYADLLWDLKAPDSMCAMPGAEHVIHIGSFSKFLAPALRLGYVSAPADVLAQLLAVKDDAGTCALTQMIVARYLNEHYDAHVAALNQRLKAKRDVLVSALRDEFGDAAEFEVPPGGIFLWVRLPAAVNTSELAPIALREGLAFNPGADWSVQGSSATRCLRICYAHPDETAIREGVALLAQLCQRECGLSLQSAAVS